MLQIVSPLHRQFCHRAAQNPNFVATCRHLSHSSLQSRDSGQFNHGKKLNHTVLLSAVLLPHHNLRISSRQFSVSSINFQDQNVPVKAVEAVQASTATSAETKSNEIVLDFLPEKPTPPSEALITKDASGNIFLGEPPLEQLGLCSNWPSGWMQYFMEQLHIGLDLPWWTTIMISKAKICAFNS